MKVLHFISHFSLLSETFIYDEITSLEKQYPHSNTVLTWERQLEQERPFQKVRVISPRPSFTQNLHRNSLKIFAGTRITRRNFSLYLFLKENLPEFDLLHAHFGWNALPLHHTLKVLGRENRIPLVVQCQGTDVNSAPELNPEYRKNFLALAQAPRVLFTANSDFMRRKMIRLGIAPEKIHLVFNAFNNTFSAQRKQNFFKKGDCLKLINTARFIEWKGQAYLIKAFARFIREVYSNTTLTLVGTGETLAPVKALAENEGVSGQIHFLGGKDHREIAKLLAEHDIYLQPSIVDPKTFQEEGLPLAVLEALAVGLPLIVTRTGGMPEIVGPDNPFARTVPDRDADALFRALKEMFEDGSCFQDTSAYAQQRLAKFTQEQQLRDLQQVYQQALNKT